MSPRGIGFLGGCEKNSEYYGHRGKTKTQGPGSLVGDTSLMGSPGSAKGSSQVPATHGGAGSARTNRGARHYKHSRGEIVSKVTYIPSPSRKANSRSPHSPLTVNTPNKQHTVTTLAAAPQHSNNATLGCGTRQPRRGVDGRARLT